MAEPAPTEAPRCMHLCCKSMVVYGEAFENDPEYQAGMIEFWCVQTGKGQAPDGGEVAMGPCSNVERECYREY